MNSALAEDLCLILLAEIVVYILLIIKEVVNVITTANVKKILQKEKAKITQSLDEFKASKEKVGLNLSGIIPDLDEDGFIIEEESEKE